MPTRLYIGVGPYPIHPQHMQVMENYGDGWIYIDKYVKQEGTLNYDAFELPFTAGSIDTIYSSHLLEHLPHPQVLKALRYWANLLKKGGKIHLNLPDMEWTCREFLKLLELERTGQKGSGYFNQSIDYINRGHDFLEIIYGSQIHDGEYHKSGFTKESLTGLLGAAGFIDISIVQEVEAHDMGCLLATATKGGLIKSVTSRLLG